MTHVNVTIPSTSEIAERRSFAMLTAERDFWKQEAEAAQAELRNIPEAVERYGYVDFRHRSEHVRLVKETDAEEAE